MVFTGSIWLRIGTSGRLLWTRYWTFGFKKMLGSCWVGEHLAEMVTLPTCIREVLGSNLRWDTDYPECDFCGSPKSFEGNAGILPRNRTWMLPFTFFPIYHTSIILPFDAILSELVTASLYKPDNNGWCKLSVINIVTCTLRLASEATREVA
jgi:hypothetical protein